MAINKPILIGKIVSVSIHENKPERTVWLEYMGKGSEERATEVNQLILKKLKAARIDVDSEQIGEDVRRPKFVAKKENKVDAMHGKIRSLLESLGAQVDTSQGAQASRQFVTLDGCGTTGLDHDRGYVAHHPKQPYQEGAKPPRKPFGFTDR